MEQLRFVGGEPNLSSRYGTQAKNKADDRNPEAHSVVDPALDELGTHIDCTGRAIVPLHRIE
jgi:hypothetical protein